MIFLTGDVHNYRDYERLKKSNVLKKLSKEDYLIVCGDLGINLDNGEFLNELKQSKYTVLFIDGNHENFPYLNSFPVEFWKGGKVHKIADNIYHLMRGQIFHLENLSFFTFGGAKSIYRKDMKEGLNYWNNLEEATELEMSEGIANLSKENFSVDYVITHTCPSIYLPLLSSYLTIFLEESKTNIYLDKIENLLNYKKWFFGHFHEDLELNQKTELLFYNIRLVK